MASYLNTAGCHLFPLRCFRWNHTLTQYLVIFGGLVFFFCLYYGGFQRSLSAALMAGTVDNRANISKNYEPPIEQLTMIDATKWRRPPISATTEMIITSTRPITTENPAASSSSATASFKSTCSASADDRGPHQRVIGYSIYSKNFSEPSFYNLHLTWFTETLRTIPVKYPGIVVYDNAIIQLNKSLNHKCPNCMLRFRNFIIY